MSSAPRRAIAANWWRARWPRSPKKTAAFSYISITPAAALASTPPRNLACCRKSIFINLGLKDIRVLTNHPKKVVALEGYGIRIADQVPLRVDEPKPTHQRF